MHRLILALFALASVCASAQTGLKFDKMVVQCEDKWIAIQRDSSATYLLEFIYIDEQAGLTADLAGTFRIQDDHFVFTKLLDSNAASVKIRVPPNADVPVAVVPAARLAEMGIDETPQWLSNYKQTTDSVARMVRWGYFYNDWGQPALALPYLEKAYGIDAGKKGLLFELTFAYNALEQYDKSIPLLEKASGADPGNCGILKELAYAYTQKEDLIRASDTYKQLVGKCAEHGDFIGETAYNIAYHYYKAGDHENFLTWYNEAKKAIGTNADLQRSLNYMKEKMEKPGGGN